MAKFDFSSAIFTLPSIGDQNTGKFDTFYLKDFILEEDLYFIDGVNKPIITRSGISRLYKGLGFQERDIDPPQIFNFNGNEILMIVIRFYDPVRNIEFFGDGEASPVNLSNQIASSYPAAMAIKRARSRAIINYLGIDAYGEDESAQFTKISVSDLSEKDLKLLEDITSKRKLIDTISGMATKLELSRNDLGVFIRNVLDIAEDTKLTLKSLTFEQLINIVTALEINTLILTHLLVI